MTFACGSRDCPRPDDQDWHLHCAAESLEHVCQWLGNVDRFPHLTHQHYPKRSAGGKEIVAMLCWPVHDACDNGVTVVLAGQKRRIKNDVAEVWSWKATEKHMVRVYRILDRDTHEVLVRVPVAPASEAAPQRLRRGAMDQFCTTPDECGDKGYCPKELACND